MHKETKELKIELMNLEKEMQNPNFWRDKQKAVSLQKRYAEIKEKIALLKKAKTPREVLEILQQNKNISNDIMLSIYAGAGGRDAEDWTAMLLNMYKRYCERKHFSVNIISEKFGEPGGPENRIGVKEVSLEIKGKGAYGLLKKEQGVHRLVRISPFSSKQLRHTSFAKIEVIPIIKQDDEDLKINEDDLKIDTFRSSGKGGQNVNKRETAIRITHIPTGLKVECQTQRNQQQNKETAMKILKSKIMDLRGKQKQEKINEEKGENIPVDFGRQIRSYVLHPYKLVKDHRTGEQTSNVNLVLDGELDLIN